jgi:carbohydrate diacid regulator
LEKGKAMDNLTQTDIEVILALADYNLNESAVARSRFMHRNTVVYHINRVKRITGLDATKFYDLCKLIQMVKECD